MQRFGDRIGVLPGVTDLASFGGEDPVLRMMGKTGLGYIIVRDKDFARGDEEVRRMTAAANSEGVLVIAWETEAAQAAKLIEWSTRPGLWVSGNPDADVLKKMAVKRWRFALNWKAGSPAEDYAASFRKLKESAAGLRFLIGVPGPALEGFSPDLLKLAGLLAPKEMNEAQMMSGGLDELGQNFITLLREVRPPAL
jgi:hypothetical protein